MKNLTRKIIPILVLLFISTLSMNAQTRAPGLQDIVGERGSSAEKMLRNRGFYHITTDKTRTEAYQYWWKYKDNQCILMRVYDGNAASIVNTTKYDCNKSDSYSVDAKNPYRYNNFEHKSHNHNNNNHHSSYEKEAAYERGFKDGKYNKSYHNVYSSDLKNEYSVGYEKGTSERSYKTSYHSGRGGYSNYEVVIDLVGRDANWAYSEIKKRGFSQQKEYQDKGVTYRVWHNNNTSQCVKTYSRDYKIFDVKKSTHCN